MLRLISGCLVVLVLVGVAVAAQPAPSAPTCDVPEVRQFDFWLGTWSLQWADGEGTNRVRRILGGCVIEEVFEGRMPNGWYRGRSVTVYDARAGVWRQTWVDDRGSYLDFEGSVQDGQMVLSRSAMKDGAPVLQRMVWRDVEADRLTWTWERSTDDGASWETLWTIRYQRAS
jgi:hypothetical protein